MRERLQRHPPLLGRYSGKRGLKGHAPKYEDIKS